MKIVIFTHILIKSSINKWSNCFNLFLCCWPKIVAPYTPRQNDTPQQQQQQQQRISPTAYEQSPTASNSAHGSYESGRESVQSQRQLPPTTSIDSSQLLTAAANNAASIAEDKYTKDSTASEKQKSGSPTRPDYNDDKNASAYAEQRYDAKQPEPLPDQAIYDYDAQPQQPLDTTIDQSQAYDPNYDTAAAGGQQQYQPEYDDSQYAQQPQYDPTYATGSEAYDQQQYDQQQYDPQQQQPYDSTQQQYEQYPAGDDYNTAYDQTTADYVQQPIATTTGAAATPSSYAESKQSDGIMGSEYSRTERPLAAASAGQQPTAAELLPK